MPWKKMLAYITGQVDEALLQKVEYLIEENCVLRNQIAKRIRLTDAERKSLAEKAVALGRIMADTVTIVKPETILKWHRQLVARKFDGSKRRKKNGRPRTNSTIEDVTIRLAKENPGWGYDRIADAIRNLGHRVSDQTIGNILKRNGLPISPEREKSTTWAEFIRRHKEVLWATDFLTTEIWTWCGLTTFYVLFFIQLSTRRIVLGGITTSPNEEWMTQVCRNLTGVERNLAGGRYLIHDRDCKYTSHFDAILKSSGIEPVRLPAQSPNLNAFAERFVRSIKSECLESMILFGEKSLRHVVDEYLKHYHAERNHQGLGNNIPFPDKRTCAPIAMEGKILKDERLGGHLKFYYCEAA